MLPVAKTLPICQVTAPISSGAFTTIAALLPAATIAAIGRGRIVGVRIKAPTVAIDVRSAAAITGDTVAVGTSEEYWTENADQLVVRSTGAAAIAVLVVSVI